MGKRQSLITGCAGFIGFHLAKALHALGHDVIGVDSFNDYYDPTLKQARALHLKNLGINVIHANLADKQTWSDLPTSITHVIHLAAQAGVRYSLTHPNTYIESNIIAFHHLLEWLKTNHRPLIFASSSSIYGTNESIPFSEKHITDSPASLYGATKKSNELFAHAYHHLFQIPMIGLRFFTVYGPFGRPDMAYYKFSKNILEGRPITIFGDGQMKRDFTYIDDIVDGIIRCVDSIDTNPRFDIYNLGNHHPESVNTLVTTLENLLHKKANIEHLTCPPTEVNATFADITKAKEELGFDPQTPLSNGLEAFTNWLQKFESFKSE
jgi:UDP-glucuronate 4-epimerase